MDTGTILGIAVILLLILAELIRHNRTQRRMADIWEKIYKTMMEGQR